MSTTALLVVLGALAAGSLDSAQPPPPVQLTPEELSTLEAGGTIYRHQPGGAVHGGLSATVVHAPPAEVWRHVLDVGSWVDFLPYITSSASVGSHQVDGHEVHHGTFALTTRGVVTHYQVESHWMADDDYVAFTVGSRRGHPLRPSVGYWQLAPWKGSGHLLIYQVDARSSWYVPGSVKRRAATRALPRLTTLIARRAEQSTSE